MTKFIKYLLIALLVILVITSGAISYSAISVIYGQRILVTILITDILLGCFIKIVHQYENGKPFN